ncbi:hypothetical protein VTO73DRAFT_1783 [Trametes versicolor]
MGDAFMPEPCDFPSSSSSYLADRSLLPPETSGEESEAIDVFMRGRQPERHFVSPILTPLSSDIGSVSDCDPHASDNDALFDGLTISVSTTFNKTANLLPIPTDLALISSDGVFFYVHIEQILSVSTNNFNNLIPSHEARPSGIEVVACVYEPATVLNVTLHAAYNMSCAHYKHSLNTLIAAVDAMPSYGMAPKVHVRPLFDLILSLAPTQPLNVYALASRHDLYSLAKPVSSHLLSFRLDTFTDELAATVAASYLSRLFLLHVTRLDALKRLLIPAPQLHPSTSECDFVEQKKLTTAWTLAAGCLAWEARADVSPSILAGALTSLAPHLSCDLCKQALAARIKDVIARWLAVQASTFEKAGIKCLVINQDTIAAAWDRHQSLWVTARSEVSILLLSPEQLASPGFESLLQFPAFYSRICGLGVDEIHLLYSWGLQFRKAFRQLGHARARLPTDTRFIGTTAMLLVGHVQDMVLAFLGLRLGEFYFPRYSNIRRNVQTIFRTLTRGLGGWSFPDIKWILRSGRKTIIHCRTIALGFRVAIYLWHLCPSHAVRQKHVRLYNALNWPAYNTETRRLMQHDAKAQIVIATASLMVGINLPNIQDVIILGLLQSADEHVQWEGRAGRDPSIVTDARCITYTSKKTQAAARALCDGAHTHEMKRSGSGKKSAAIQMDVSMARLLLAPCATDEQNTLYGNPLSDPPCLCPRCMAPAVDRPDNSTTSPPSIYPSPCSCSGCKPEDVAPAVGSLKRKDMNPVPKRQRLNKAMRAVGTKHLERTRMAIYRSSKTETSRALTPDVYLPATLIKTILDRYALLVTRAALQEAVGDSYVYLLPHLDLLWSAVQELSPIFEKIRAEAAASESSADACGTHLQELSLEECCSEFEVNGVTPVVHTEESQRVALEVSRAGWNLNDVFPSGGPSRKRSSTTTPLPQQPEPARRRVMNKENVNPAIGA